MLDPERAVQQRIILLGSAQLEPDAPQSVQRLQPRRSDVGIIIPKQAATKRWPVSQQSGKKNGRRSGHILKNGYLRNWLRNDWISLQTRAQRTLGTLATTL